jgi:predicted N-acetyltransferase YhbS
MKRATLSAACAARAIGTRFTSNCCGWLIKGGTGIGRQIIESAEAFAVANDCEKALVETTSWQARPFYERNGYELLATLDGRPRGHASHYLAKTLLPTDATP